MWGSLNEAQENKIELHAEPFYLITRKIHAYIWLGRSLALVQKKKERSICYFAAEGFGFSKEVLRFVAKLLCKGTCNKNIVSSAIFHGEYNRKNFFPWCDLSLISSPSEKVLRTALALYMDGGDMTLPLPTHEEVLICNQTTTTEEVHNYLIFSFLSDLAPLCSDCTPVYACYLYAKLCVCVHAKNENVCVIAEGIYPGYSTVATCHWWSRIQANLLPFACREAVLPGLWSSFTVLVRALPGKKTRWVAF